MTSIKNYYYNNKRILINKKTQKLTIDGSISQKKSNNKEIIMPISIDPVNVTTENPVNVTTESSSASAMPPGTIAAIAMGGGGAIGGVGGGVLGGLVGGASLCIAAGGIGLVVGGVVGGIVTLSIYLSQKPKYTRAQLDQIKTNKEAIITLEQQPALIAQAVLSNVHEHINQVVLQAGEQNQHMGSAINAFTETVANASETTETLKHATQAMHLAANNTIINAQAVEKKLRRARKRFDEVTHALQQTQSSLTDTESKLHETHDKLAVSQEELSITASIARHQLTHLCNRQQLIDEALHQIESGKNQDADLEILQKHIKKLSSKNESLNVMVKKLSKNIIILIAENTTLRAENSTLKQTIALLFQAPDKQNIQEKSGSKSSHSNPYSPLMFRERACTH